MSDDKRLVKYVDEAMYKAQDIDALSGPRVTLVSMTSDPLANVAVAAAVYKGDIKRTTADVTDEERAYYLQQMLKTKLAAPLETIHLFFQFEGVTRAFTHQLVRQRTAVYFQESMRFAVKETMPVGLPPSLAGTKSFFDWGHEQFGMRDNVTEQEWAAQYDRATDEQKNRLDWDDCIRVIEQTYNRMISRGMPAEDARGLAPTNVLTRINYDTNLRSLMDHAGNRLCTQAQFEWRQVFSGIVQAIREQGPKLDTRYIVNKMDENSDISTSGEYIRMLRESNKRIEQEYAAIASLFKPICYQVGHCTFNADFDRKCSIRSRVEANAAIGRKSSEWEQEYDHVDPLTVAIYNPNLKTVHDEDGTPKFIGPIRPAEWLMDPGAAR